MLQKKQHTLQNGQTIAYLAEQSQNPTTYLFLAPGASDSTFFNHFYEYIRGKSFIIPDYPGRGDSDTQEDNSIKGIAISIEALLTELKIDKVKIIASSYGTQVAWELLKLNSARYTEAHLISAGQFYGKITRYLYRAFFWIPLHFPSTAPAFRNFLIKRGDLDNNFPTKNLHDICKQLISTLSFTYDNFEPITLIYLYNFKQDTIVDQNSLRKLKKLCKNLTVYDLDGGHPLNIKAYAQFESEYLGKILD